MFTYDIDSRQSTLIKAMRFPLIVLVVIAHSLGFEHTDITGDTVGYNVYHFFSEMLSHNLARLAVCWFFTISGYYFFRYLKDEEFNFKWVIRKWKKRIWSLLIPYIIWNLLMVGANYAKGVAFSSIGIGTHNDLPQFAPVEWLWSGPANFPLYFMRDLMIMSIIAPLWYLIVRKMKWLSLTVLILIYASPLNPQIPGMRAIFFFGIGNWLGIWKYNMLEIAQKVKWPAAILAVLTLLVASYWNASPHHEWLIRAFYPFGMLTFMNICDRLIDSEKRRDTLCRLSSAVFFIYASHEILILGWTKGLFLRTFGRGLAGAWISYLCVPIVVLFVCLLLCRILNRIMPRTLSFICGNR